MKFGLVYAFRSPSGLSSDVSRQYGDALEQILLAERYGFTAALVCEHHFAEDGYLPSPIVAASGIASKTSRIKVGTGILILPLHNPIRVAEDAAVVDVISNGRFILGVGSGWRREEFDAFDLDFSHRLSSVKGGIEGIKRLWTEPSVDLLWTRFRFKNASLAPKPLQKPHPPIWMAAKSEAGVRIAAKIADAWFPSPNMNMNDLKERLQVYRQELKQAGRDPSQLEFPVFRDGYIAKDTDTALEEYKKPIMYTQRKYWEWRHHRGWDGAEVEWDEEAMYKRHQEMFVIGGVDDFIGKVERYQRELGVTQIILGIHQPGLKHGKVLDAIRLIGERVLPYLTEKG